MDTPFFRAMKLAKGTVSVLDKRGTAWTRIWCKSLFSALEPLVVFLSALLQVFSSYTGV